MGKVEEARQALARAQQAVKDAEEAVRQAEVEERAAAFAPNATVLQDVLPMFHMNAETVTPNLVTGERVQLLGEPAASWQDVVAVRKDGRTFRVREEDVRRD